MKRKKRIDLSIGEIPESTKQLIEDLVNKERTFRAFVQEPRSVFAKYGLSFSSDISERDVYRVLDVIGRIRATISNKTEFIFEELFDAPRIADFQFRHETKTGVSSSFESSSSTESSTVAHTDTKASILDPIREVGLRAPLLDRADLAAIMTELSIAVKTRVG